jgi:NAD(P)H-dependent FMN reductase
VTSEIAQQTAFTIERIDPLALGLTFGSQPSSESALAALQQRIAAADAFIVLAPEYNHSFSASLKAVIDSVYDDWQAKPVGFVSYGGQSGGIRAVEQLRLVFAELHAVTLRDNVALANVWERFAPDGTLVNPERPRRALTTLLGQLKWWATALRTARQVAPYADVAA